MNLTDICNTLLYLVTLGSSLMLLIFPLFMMNYEKKLAKTIKTPAYNFAKQKVMSVSFFAPVLFLLLGAITLSLPKLSNGTYLISIAEMLLFIGFFISIFVDKLNRKYLSIVRLSIMAVSSAVFLLCLFFKGLSEAISANLVVIPVIMLCSAALLYLYRKEKGTGEMLFWGVISFLTAEICKFFELQHIMMPVIILILKILAYLLMTFYFARSINDAFAQLFGEATEKLESLNKTIDREVKKRMFEVERSNERLLTISKTDALTKALNKAAIMDMMEDWIDKNISFSLLMFDIDKFKKINDTYGHVTGDKCIKTLAVISKSAVRDNDHVGRYGGDEFVVLLKNSEAMDARIIAERVRSKIAETDSPRMTISIGIASFPNDATAIKGLFAIADDGLYASKHKGGNAVSYKNVF